MKKHLTTLAAIVLFLISNNVSGQSTLIIENPSTRPVYVKNVNTDQEAVPVKITNIQPAGKTMTPFTQQSGATLDSIGKVKITAAAGETKVVEFVMAYSSITNIMKVTYNGKIYRLPMTGVGGGLTSFNSPMNIVITGGTVEFSLDTLGGGIGERLVMVSGYLLK